MVMRTNPDYTLTGQITNSEGVPLAGISVLAFDKDPRSPDDPLGKAFTDAEGQYTIHFLEDAFQMHGVERTGPDVYIRVYDGDMLLGESPIEHNSKNTINISLSVGQAKYDASNALLRVYGTIRDQYGDLLSNVTVQAFDCDLRSEQMLGTFQITGRGRYEIRYTRSQFRRSEKNSADLVIKVFDLKDQELHKTPIQYNVPADFQLDITLQGASYQGPSEWDTLTDAFTPLLEDTLPLDLRENDQYQDISFLAGETDTPRLTVGIWVICFHLADKTNREKTPLPPEVFYGYLRQGQPSIFTDTLVQDMQEPDRITLLADKILRGLADFLPALQQSLLEKAITNNLIPARVGPDIPAVLETLQRIKLGYAAQVSFGGGKGTIGQLLALTPAAVQSQDKFLAALTAHTGSLDSFWKKQTDDRILDSDATKNAEAVRRVKLTFELGALTRNHIPLVAELARRVEAGDLKAKRDLARYDRAAWKKLFGASGPDGKPIGVPANIDGDTEDARREQFAAILEEQFARAYPTTAFAGKLDRADKSPIKAQADIVRFLDNNPEFQLDRYRIDHYVAEHDEALKGIKDKTTLLSDLKSVQRVFKLSRDYSVVDTLLNNKIDSAQQIYFMGQSQFVTAMAGMGMNAIEMRKVYRKAESTYALALAMYGDYNVALSGASPLAVPNTTSDPELQSKIAALPNLQTLFGSLDYCECTHCRSVYSPAAHFVDILRFLGERLTQGSAVNAGKNVAQVLLERRPDLGEIELSCENTDTPLPYIDLVNEVLEDVVAPPEPVVLNAAIETHLVEGKIKSAVLNELLAKSIPIDADAHVYAPDSRGQWVVRDTQHAYKLFKIGATLNLLPSRQTLLSAAELRANPAYTNLSAYTRLQGEVFPFNLPFDLWLVQTRAYLKHLGIPLPRLLELFQQKQSDDVTLVPSQLQIDCAWLDISETERQILTGTLAGKPSWEYWGLAKLNNDILNPATPTDPTTNVVGSWIDVLSKVDIMLNRAGLTYKELLQLLDMQFVNPTGNITIQDNVDPNAANCDTSTFTLQNLTAAALDRMHRFIRLWRKLGCAMWELDLLLPDVTSTDDHITDATLQGISHMNQFRQAANLDWRVVYSLYHGLDHPTYIDHTQDDASAMQTLYQQLFRNKLVDAVANFPAKPADVGGAIADSIPGILAAFRIKEADLTLILTDQALAPADALNVVILGNIYRIAVLAQALNLNIDQFLCLKRLWAQDPFATPAATRSFVELAQQITTSNLSVLELDYLLAHKFSQNTGIALEDKTIITVITALREGLQKIEADIRRKSEETDAAYVKSKLGRLPVLVKDADQTTALSIINGTWQGTPANRDTLIDTFFTGVLETAVAKVNLAAITDGLSPADLQVVVDQRFAFVQLGLQAFLLQTEQEALIYQKVAELLQLDTPSASALLNTLHVPGAPVTLLAALNETRLLATHPDNTYQFPPDEVSFPDIYKSLRLLHKNALVIDKLQIKAEELIWWLEGTHAANMGWMHPGDFPITADAPLAIASWVNLQQFFSWKDDLPKSDLTAFEFATRVLDNTQTSAANLADLAHLTANDISDLNELAEAFHWRHIPPPAFDNLKQQLLKSSNLKRLSDCMYALHRLGVNAARAVAWATATPDDIIADNLKQTVKSKYDLPQWQQVIQPLQDDFREQKRHALVNWLVAHPNQANGQTWTDTSGLYSYFLIDVEMSACMLTSRMVQATSSVQLFVQRCLLNLEVDILAKTDLDSKWKQWQWMKRYRVWEANRKIFLYPENWIEPELRDEKSPFFKDLEAELMQNDVTNDTAEQAYLNYLEKLDKVANLEIRAMYNQVISPDESVLHVFGRTRSSQSPEHYYRKRINAGRWLAWEKVELDINANHLVAGIHNRRLYLLWPQFTEKAVTPININTPDANSSAIIMQPTKYWEVRLFWSELKKGKWTPKVLSDAFDTVYQSKTGGDKPQNIALRTRLAPYIQVRLYTSDNPASEAPRSLNQFDKIGKAVSRRNSPYTEHIISPAESQYYNNMIRHNTSANYFYYGSVHETGKPHTLSAHEHALGIQVLGNVNSRETYSVIDTQAESFVDDSSFFMWDPQHTYFVDYSWRTQNTYFSRAWHTQQVSSFRFYTHYHPFVELFIKELNIWGIKGLLNRRIQIDPASIPGSPTPFNFADYQPTSRVVKNYSLPDKTLSYPVEDVDFTYAGAYAPYNWELFFHVPFFIANRLSVNQRFEEALAWYHYIFDPTSTDTAVSDPETPQQKFWMTKPFYETTKADYYKQKIENIMLAIAKGDAELREQVQEWRENPFNPHLIARMRTVAYQKNVLIKYIQTLIAWSDLLFRQDTMESINEATQLYILADSILGPRPKSIPRKVANPTKTYYQLQQEGIDTFGNTLKEIENLLPNVPNGGTPNDNAPELPRLDVLYFSIPNNEKLLGLWDTVADRLFKLRHCMNIEGVVRSLALFEPPIDPAMLVRAVAAGLDISTVLSDLNAPLPLYRFNFMIQRALEMCQNVQALGGAMLAALEKRDGEEFAKLRSSHERIMLDHVRLIKDKQVNEALRNKEAADESKKVVEERRDYYQKLIKDGWSAGEHAAFGLSIASTALDAAIATGYIMSGGLKLIPSFLAGAAGFGGSPTVTVTMGGEQIGNSAEMAVRTLQSIAAALDKGANLASTVASYERRDTEWEYQQRLAEKELPQVNRQIAAAVLRHEIAIQDLANQDKQIENQAKEDEYLHTKFTNQELYNFMVSQLSTVYFQSYQLAYGIAKQAERSFRYELGLTDSSYIQFGYWDSLRQGLLAGEKLFYDLKRLESAYYEQNRREYELTKHISLAQLDPVALLKLRQNGECFVGIPEAVFDMDYPGHYFRRIKSVSLSIPCITGPYTTVACTLTLTSNHLRKEATLLTNKYARDSVNDDPRFRDEIAAIQSIATSTAQNDDGLFELSFRDERYLPFEGAGAISSWHIKLNKDLPQFDFASLSDVVIHLNYTAREGGELLRAKAVEEFNKKLNDLALAENRHGLFRVFDLRREFPDKFYSFLHPANSADDQVMLLDDLGDRLPYFTRPFINKKVRQVELVALMKDGASYKAQLSPLGVAVGDLLTLALDVTYQGLHRALKDLTGSEINFGAWTLKLQIEGAGDFKSLPVDAVKELFLIINYTIA